MGPHSAPEISPSIVVVRVQAGAVGKSPSGAGTAFRLSVGPIPSPTQYDLMDPNFPILWGAVQCTGCMLMHQDNDKNLLSSVFCDFSWELRSK
jgi:hypothetical protein